MPIMDDVFHAALTAALAEIPEGKSVAVLLSTDQTGQAQMHFALRVKDGWTIGASWGAPEPAAWDGHARPVGYVGVEWSR